MGNVESGSSRGHAVVDRFSRIIIAALATVLTLVSLPAWSHEDGSDDFSCDQGPFGVPGLTDPPDQIGQWSAVTNWPDSLP